VSGINSLLKVYQNKVFKTISGPKRQYVMGGGGWEGASLEKQSCDLRNFY